MTLFGKRLTGVIAALTLALGSLACSDHRAPATDDQATLATLLDEFLAGASRADADIHERFWHDDLVYTSSAGLRTDKASIVGGMRGAENSEPPTVVYAAEQVDIRLYDDVAIVAFELVGTPADSETPARRYLNTGTFLKSNNEWRAIAWQATHKAEVEQ